MTERPVSDIRTDEYVPMSLWGKDHWSLLRYMASVIKDTGTGFEVEYIKAGRMRQGRRNDRVMREQNPRPSRPSLCTRGMVMDLKYGSLLNDGTYVPGHDEWHCVQDFANAGLLDTDPTGVESGEFVHLSELGDRVVDALRRHKSAGGNYHAFRWLDEAT